MNPAEFLTLLWGDIPPGLISLWRLADKKSFYIRAPIGAMSLANTQRDVYTSVALTDKDYGAHSRATAEQATAIAGLWLDIDINGGPDNKTGALPAIDDALNVARRFATPTIVINSGYGLHAWWLFDEPYRFRTQAAQEHGKKLAGQWYKLHSDFCAESSWRLDPAYDLARLLRLPGTTNAKGGMTAPVDVLEHEGDRYDVAELAEICARAGDVPERKFNDVAGINLNTSLDSTLFADLYKTNATFAATWNHERDDKPNWSFSEHDMSLCGHATRAGWSENQLAALIVEHRQRVDPSGVKAMRTDYIQRTIAQARQEDDDLPPAKPVSNLANGKLLQYTPEKWADVLYDALNSKDAPVVSTPFVEINQALDGGLRAGEVAIVSGWTSHGKSALLDQIADHAAEQDKQIHLYLTEGSAVARGFRLLARRTGIPLHILRRRELSPEQCAQIVNELKQLRYGCSIVTGWKVDDVVADIHKNRWDLVVVDLLHGFHYADERDLSKTSSALVRAAKGFHPGTIVLAAAHLNDGQLRDQRGAARPKPGLHSIKGSSSIKQDADIVMFIWRQDDEDGIPTEESSLWIAKNRDGGFGATKLTFHPTQMRFRERDEF